MTPCPFLANLSSFPSVWAWQDDRVRLLHADMCVFFFSTQWARSPTIHLSFSHTHLHVSSFDDLYPPLPLLRVVASIRFPCRSHTFFLSFPFLFIFGYLPWISSRTSRSERRGYIRNPEIFTTSQKNGDERGRNETSERERAGLQGKEGMSIIQTVTCQKSSRDRRVRGAVLSGLSVQ